jgi:hypothetical protein
MCLPSRCLATTALLFRYSTVSTHCSLSEYRRSFISHVSAPDVLPWFDSRGDYSPTTPALSLRPFVMSGSPVMCQLVQCTIFFLNFFCGCKNFRVSPAPKRFQLLRYRQVLLPLRRWPNLLQCPAIHFPQPTRILDFSLFDLKLHEFPEGHVGCPLLLLPSCASALYSTFALQARPSFRGSSCNIVSAWTLQLYPLRTAGTERRINRFRAASPHNYEYVSIIISVLQ